MACSMNKQVIQTKMSLALIRVSLAAYAKIQRSKFQGDPCLDLDLPVCSVGKSVEQNNNNLDVPGEGP